jgi:hypothetical protein
MDGRKPSFPLNDLCGQPGTDVGPIAAGIEQSGGPGDSLAVSRRDSIDRLSATQRESSQIVFCGTDERVREGFAIALFAMGVDADLLPADIALPAQHPNSEE